MSTVHVNQPAVLLDLDNTILDFNKAERIALGRALGELGLPVSDEIAARYNKINIRHWEMLEDGILTREQVLVQRFETLFRELGVEADADRAQSLYESYLAEGQPIEQHKQYCRLVYGHRQRHKEQKYQERADVASFEKRQGEQHHEKLFISEHMDGNKPELRFFEDCFRQIPSFKRDRAIILGDSLSSDIRGGINAGILTCWFNPDKRENSGPIKPDYEIVKLAEFPALLETIFS